MVLEYDRTGTWHAYGTNASDKAQSSSDHDPDSQQFAFVKPASLAGSTRFAGYLALQFPELVAKIEKEDLGVLHLEVGTLKMATNDAIGREDWPTVRQHFDFVDRILEIAEHELHDAIGTFYLISLFFNRTSINFAKARMMMPKRLALALEIMERHYEDLM